MPECDDVTSEQIERSLDHYLCKSDVRGLILAGLDRDHACPAGMESILTRYDPAWIMYRKYFKDTDAAADLSDGPVGLGLIQRSSNSALSFVVIVHRVLQHPMTARSTDRVESRKTDPSVAKCPSVPLSGYFDDTLESRASDCDAKNSYRGFTAFLPCSSGPLGISPDPSAYFDSVNKFFDNKLLSCASLCFSRCSEQAHFPRSLGS
jgi:hypothetical protein